MQDIVSISVEKGSFVVDIYFTQFWKDERLRYDHIDPCRFNISLDYRLVETIWNPNVCMANSYMTRTHQSPSPNVLAMIYKNGAVMLNHRVRVQAPCVIDLTRFPMDVQVSHSLNCSSAQKNDNRCAH